ncbi:MAG TPA: hypothetical protein VI997_10985, partial [Candidatus Thermoplasmatota archaeon]|nr:hypothetical protein [Candidatus Thermoplasmatota archaeon]
PDDARPRVAPLPRVSLPAHVEEAREVARFVASSDVEALSFEQLEALLADLDGRRGRILDLPETRRLASQDVLEVLDDLLERTTRALQKARRRRHSPIGRLLG